MLVFLSFKLFLTVYKGHNYDGHVCAHWRECGSVCLSVFLPSDQNYRF